MIRVAVVGVGSMGRNHVRVYNEMPETELVAFVDSNPRATEQIEKLYRVSVYNNVSEMLEKERPDAVSVVVPTIEHFKVTKQILEAGCHVLVEKPIAATVEDAEVLIYTAERMNRVLMVGHIERFNPAIIELKRRLELGELGQIFQIYARRLGPFPTRINDVGVVMDLAPHDISILLYLLGQNPISVSARGMSCVSEGVYDIAYLNLVFPNNISAQVHGLQSRSTGTLPLLGVAQGIFTTLSSMFGVEIRFEPPPPDLWRYGLPESEAVPLALVMNEIGTNALKHRASRSDGIMVRVSGRPDGMVFEIENPGQLPAGFDLAQIAASVSGLGLVKAPLPRRGAKQTLGQSGAMEAARLQLFPPSIREDSV